MIHQFKKNTCNKVELNKMNNHLTLENQLIIHSKEDIKKMFKKLERILIILMFLILT